jgi:hypothetical protein
MPIKKVTPEEQAIRDAKDKRVSDYIKEGKTIEEARALVEAAKALSNNQN